MYLIDQVITCDENIYFQTTNGPRVIAPKTELKILNIGVCFDGTIAVEFHEVKGVIFPLTTSMKPIDDLNEEEIKY